MHRVDTHPHRPVGASIWLIMVRMTFSPFTGPRIWISPSPTTEMEHCRTGSSDSGRPGA